MVGWSIAMSPGVEGRELDVLELQERVRFEQLVLPHVDAAFNLARWVLRGRNDAEDVAQEALLRAYRFFRGFNGADARAWLLQIVRNACYSWLEKNRPWISRLNSTNSFIRNRAPHLNRLRLPVTTKSV